MTYGDIIFCFFVSVIAIIGFVLFYMFALKKKFKSTKEPIFILKDMVAWRLRYYDACNDESIKTFKNIDRYLLRTSYIVENVILNHDNSFEHIELKEVKLKDIPYEFRDIMKEFRECDENVRTLFLEMNELLNRIANYKNPIRYRCLIFKKNIQLHILLLYLICLRLLPNKNVSLEQLDISEDFAKEEKNKITYGY